MISLETVGYIRNVHRALDNDRRSDIFNMLLESGPLTVTDIYIKLRRGQSSTSQDLAIMRKAGVLNEERSGIYIYYSVNRDNPYFKMYCNEK